ncbi:MAG: hypothetical protein ACXACC_01500 [Promethearchaeota archaeon]
MTTKRFSRQPKDCYCVVMSSAPRMGKLNILSILQIKIRYGMNHHP